MEQFKYILTWILRILLFLVIPYSLYVKDYLFIFGAMSAAIVSLLPVIWSKNLKAHLPLSLDFFVTTALVMHIFLGEVFRFYDTNWYFDKIMHFYGTALIALIAFLTIFTLHWTKKVVLTVPYIAYFTFIFSVAVGTFWEIGEFLIDQFFNRNTQYSLENTMYDSIFNVIGGLAAALFGAFYTKHKNKSELKKMAGSMKSILKS